MKIEKSVLILWEELPQGLIANTAAILGVSLGIYAPKLIREDVMDAQQRTHTGIIQYPLPVLKANQQTLQEIYAKLPQYDEDIFFIDFTDIAQSCLDYDDYICKMRTACPTTMQFYGIAMTGSKKAVNRLSGSLPLLR